MTSPIDITDPRIIKAIAHPLRLRILAVLNGRVASPSEIADELGTPLSNTSYHVRQLAALGFLQLVDRAARRGAIEHYYTATVRPTISGDAWARVPAILRSAMVSSDLQEGVAELAAAVEAGGFAREDIHYSRTNGRLDQEGWQAVAAELSALTGRLGAIFARSEARVLASGEPAEDASIMLLQFAAPSAAPDVLELDGDNLEKASQSRDQPPVRFPDA